jgi:hypothetical protein
MAGVVGVIGFPHDAKYAPEAIDYEMIGMVAADVFEQTFAGTLERSVLILFKGDHVALGGVEDDSSWVEAQSSGAGVDAFSWECKIRSGLSLSDVLILQLETVAVEVKARVRFHQPHAARRSIGLRQFMRSGEVRFGQRSVSPDWFD